MRSAINYDKYSKMTTKQLLNSLDSAKNKRVRFQTQVNDANELIDFLTEKIKDSLNMSKKSDFVPLEKTGLIELAKEIEKKMTPEELEQLQQELEADISRDYGDE